MDKLVNFELKMKHKLINIETNEETFCDCVEIDGYKYYVSDEKIKPGVTTISGNIALKFGWNWGFNEIKDEKQAENENALAELTKGNTPSLMFKTIIATDNSGIKAPKVVDMVESLARKEFNELPESQRYNWFNWLDIYKSGYSKSQTTYPNSDEDMIEFSKHCIRQFVLFNNRDNDFTERLLPEWKENNPKIIYYK